MNGNDLINAMTDVDDRHILAAEKKPRRKPLLIGITALAAALAVAVGLTVFLQSPRLPKLRVEPMYVGGMGGGGEQKELQSGNPAAGKTFKKLPVFQSESAAPDREKMMKLLENAAQALDADLAKAEIRDSVPTAEAEQKLREQYEGYGAPEEEIERIIKNQRIYSDISAKFDKLRISVWSDYSVSIVWNDDARLELPEDVKPSANASFEELGRAGEYMIENYPELFNFKNPVRNTDHEFRGSAYIGSVEYFEGGGSDLESFLGYNLKKADINFDDAGGVRSIYIYTDEGLSEIGEYPIITPEKAEELLYSGCYQTNVTNYEIKGGEEIALTELYYRTGAGNEYVMPFYCMYVKLSDEELGIEPSEESGYSYYEYYVPAVEGKYLENMPYKEIAH